MSGKSPRELASVLVVPLLVVAMTTASDASGMSDPFFLSKQAGRYVALARNCLDPGGGANVVAIVSQAVSKEFGERNAIRFLHDTELEAAKQIDGSECDRRLMTSVLEVLLRMMKRD